MLERVVTIYNQAGIHCRPSSTILTAITSDFPNTTFSLVDRDGEHELNSILSLISLGLQCQTKITLKVVGGDEENALQQIGDLFEFEFDFPPQ